MLFVHDHVFHIGQNSTVFSPGRLPYSAFNRYLESFTSLEVLARSLPIAQETKSLNEASGPNVSFCFDHGYRGPADLLRNGRRVIENVGRAVERADAVIVRLPSELGQIAVRACIKMQQPVAVEVVGCAFDAYWNYGSLFAKAYAPVMYARMRRAVARSPFALYVTREFLQRRYPSNGVSAAVSDVDLRESPQDVLPGRTRRIDESVRVSLGFIGSLHSRYKGLDTALKAVNVLRLEGKQVHLRVLGDGDQTYWRELASELGVQDLVTFEGVLPSGGPVYRWLDDIDVFIQPSKQDGLPRSVVEAMSRACPVIGSTAGGIPELLPAACLHAPGDWRGLARRLREVAWNPQKKRILAKRNWEESQRYDHDRLSTERREFFCRFAEYASQRKRR